MQYAMWCDLCYFCEFWTIMELDGCLTIRRVIMKLGASVPANPDTVYDLHAVLGDQRTIPQ